MPFRVAQETLEALEWPAVVALLQSECRTAQASVRLADALRIDVEPSTLIGAEAGSDAAMVTGASAPTRAATPIEPRVPSLFESTLAGVERRLAETSQARALLDDEQIPPLGHAADIVPALRRARIGGVLDLAQLSEIRAVLRTIHGLARFLAGRSDAAPDLADIAETIEEQVDLEEEIDLCLDSAGELRDDASPALAEARRQSIRLGGELQKRLGRYLQNPDIANHLSDSYYTVRNDRYVLPVKADSKGRVRGIVHDASRSGTTLFVEPEGTVDLNNRRKQAELAILRETQRILRRLSSLVAQASAALQHALESLTLIDLAFARGRLSQRMDATAPQVGSDGTFVLPALRHPLIDPDQCVSNDVRLGDDFAVLVLSGPNAGGKTVTMKAVALCALFVRAGLHVPCASGARVDLVEHVVADIGDGQDIGESLSTFSAHMANLSHIVTSARRHSLVVLDEIGVGTDPGEGAALAQSILERLAGSGARVIATTHYNLLKEMADVDPRFENASVAFDPETLAPTYRIQLGSPGVSSASAVAARMGMPSDVLERADGLLRREDRQLDRMLSELASSRAQLETERQRAAEVRAESEATRSEYRTRLVRLQEQRDKLYRSMREDLDTAFKQAHADVASVIRELQRGPSSQQAAAARERLQTLESRAEESASRAGVERNAAPVGLIPVDWRRIEPGDAVRVDGAGEAVLLSMPDHRGRVSVRAGGAKLLLPAERIGQASAKQPRPDTRRHSTTRPKEARVTVQRAFTAPDALGGGRKRCDLRGRHVEEALDELDSVLDRAAADGCDELFVVHGLGTGALRKAVRGFLHESRWVSKLRPGDDDEGGEGVTIALLDGHP
ncbi:MAG: Smr/MutS family protein [Deltaproteobacteria bacterium]|nr:Smr/MutS family protein [Deltaproteobacteria bacterium]